MIMYTQLQSLLKTLLLLIDNFQHMIREVLSLSLKQFPERMQGIVIGVVILSALVMFSA